MKPMTPSSHFVATFLSMKSFYFHTLFWGLVLLISCKPTQLATDTAPPPTAANAPDVMHMKVLDNALGLDLKEVSYSWEPGHLQKAFQIKVASSQERLAVGVGDLWDSGKRFSERSKDHVHQGKALPTGRDLYWQVSTWDANGDKQESKVANFNLIQPEQDSGEVENRIALLGGTLISHMDKYGYFETAITTHWPQHHITFRNIGWPGDDVFGTARAEFGSATNTRSWKPPDAEEGFGFEVLNEHIAGAQPSTIIVGYGAEAAFAETDDAYQEFERGYTNLLKTLATSGANLILLSPIRQQHVIASMAPPIERNKRLAQATSFIEALATAGNHRFIDLFHTVIPSDKFAIITDNGMHLNEEGYRRMSQVLLNSLGIKGAGAEINFNEEGEVLNSNGVQTNGFTKTSRGFRLDIKADRLSLNEQLKVPSEHLVKVDGEIVREREFTARLNNKAAIAQYEELRELIIEKNRLHHYRIRPLNKAYIFLFRQHEMGHLAYELEDFDRLVEEKEELIARLRIPQSHRYEVEILEPWKSPREYPDHEVPEFIPSPNVEEELAAFTVTEGAEVNLFAADPMISNPINLNWDIKGRAWVATSSTYPHIKPGREPNDKIIILEDTDQDGVADKHTVFAEGLLIPHSVIPVKGGAYVCTTTEVHFYADKDGDDVADSKQIVFSGFGNADVHHTIHGFRWAPWGDLYFTQSIYINSFLETPYGQRQLNGSGTWQFRPETGRLEVFARGQVNPWGFAFDDWGQSFGTDGAGSQQPSYVYPGAAHATAVGAERILDGLIKSKPKNTAAEFLNGRHIPESWAGKLMASDFRANRTILYDLSQSGSSYAAEEVETVLHSNHRSYRPVDMKMGPDGAVYIVDWYNPIIDHGEVDFHHPLRDKSHGRIWRITNKNKPVLEIPKIHGASTAALLELLKSPEQLTRLLANRELVMQECDASEVNLWVKNLDKKEADYEHHRLEGLWLLGALNSPNADLLKQVLSSKDYRARAAAARIVAQWKEKIDGLALLKEMVHDVHPQVRLEAVNALRMLGGLQAANLALEALDHEVDNDLDYMLWLTARESQIYWLPALEKGQEVFGGNLDRLSFALKAANNAEAIQSLTGLVNAGKLVGKEKQNALQLIAALGGEAELGMVLASAAELEDIDLLNALVKAPSSNTNTPKNVALLADLLTNESSQVRTLAAQLVGRWKSGATSHVLKAQASNQQAPSTERLAAANALGQLGEIDILKSLATGQGHLGVRTTSAVAWINHQPEAAAASTVDILSKLSSEAYAAMLFQSYIDRKGGPDMLEEALSGKTIPTKIALRGIRQIQASGRDLSGLEKALTKSGSLQPVGLSLTGTQQRDLLDQLPRNGSSNRGRQIYNRAELQCTTCHEINGKGGKLGPNISTLGAYMTPASILESLLNPGTAIKQGYETVVLTKKDGSIVSGTLQRRSDEGALIRIPGGKTVSVTTSEIADFALSPVSLMPPGLTASLRQDELLDLMKYLTTLGK